MSGLGRRTHYRKHLTDSVLYDYPEPASNECIAKIIATRGSNQFDIQLAKSCNDPKKDSGDEKQGCSSKNDGIELAILPTKFRKLIWLKRNDFVIVQYATDDNTDTTTGNHNEKSKMNDLSTLPSQDEKETPDDTVSAVVPNESISMGGGGIRYMITHILYKNQIQHLVTAGLWPTHDPNFHDTSTTNGDNSTTTTTTMDRNGIVFTTNKNDDKLIGHDDDDNFASNNNDTEDRAKDDSDDNGDGSGDYNDNDDDSTDSDNDDDLFINTNRMARIELQDSDEE